MEVNKHIKIIDLFILGLLFGLLPIDMLNGYLLRKIGLESVFSVAQAYKSIVFLFLFIRIRLVYKLFILFLFLILWFPSTVQSVKQNDLVLLVKDVIKIIRYITSVLAFLYFRQLILSGYISLSKISKWFVFSFVFVTIIK